MEEGWRRGDRRVKVGLRELEGRKLGQGRREGGDIWEGVGMRKGGRDGW